MSEPPIVIPIGWLNDTAIMATVTFNQPVRKGLLRELARFLIALEDMADEWEEAPVVIEKQWREPGSDAIGIAPDFNTPEEGV